MRIITSTDGLGAFSPGREDRDEAQIPSEKPLFGSP
jgi:hypothetical protein